MSLEEDDSQSSFLKDGPNTRSHFFELYNKEAKDYDEKFVKRYNDDLNTTLIFAGLLAAVSSAFILNVQTNFQPDYTATTAALVKILIHTIDNSTFAGMDLTLPEWTGPDNATVAVQTLLYSSLAATILAAFVAMLGKQWVSNYAQAEMRRSLVQSCYDRQQKLDGMENWKLRVIMESVPLMLQSSLLFLGIALSRYIWGIDKTVAAVIVGVTSFGILFYTFIVISAAIFYYCPFRTPFSAPLRSFMKHVYNRLPSELKSLGHLYIHSISDFLSLSVGAGKKWLIEPFAHSFLASAQTPLETDIARFFDDPKIDLVSNKLDVRCVMWMCDTSTDPNVAMATMQFISEIEWNDDVGLSTSIPPTILDLAIQVHGYCELMNSYPSTIDSTKDKAYAAAKAFLHLYVQRRCVNEEEVDAIKDLGYLGHHAGVWNNDLESTLWMIDHMVEGRDMVIWPEFNRHTDVSTPHISWFCHILLYYVWASKKRDAADSVVKSLDPLLELSLSRSASLSLTTIADCILICALTLGRQVSLGELSVTSKGSEFKIFTLCIVSRALDSREISILVDELCNILKKAFQLDAPSRHVERAVEVLQMLTLWQGQQRTKYIKANPTLNLCRTILNSAIGDKIKWKAARLVMQIGFRDRRSDLYYDSPTVCITFLEHHLTQEPQYRDYDSVADALRALSSIHPMPINAFSEGNVVRGICWALRNEGPTGLTEMVLLLVHRSRHALWETATQSLLIEHCFSAALKKAWDRLVLANNRDAVYTRKYLDILAYMSDSSIWHPYIFGDHWDGFEHAAPLDRVWVIPLLEGEYARKTFGLKAVVECIRVAWKTGSYLEHVELPGLVYRTINLLVLKGQPAVSELDEEINNALRAVGAEERNTDVYPVDVQLRLAVLKEIVGFVKDVKTDMPDGWERCVVTKAKVRRRKFVARFRRRSSEIECGKRRD